MVLTRVCAGSASRDGVWQALGLGQLIYIPGHTLPSKAAVRAVQAMNRICVLDVDLQGVRNIKKSDLCPIYISVQPPSLAVLVGAGYRQVVGRCGQMPRRH